MLSSPELFFSACEIFLLLSFKIFEAVLKCCSSSPLGLFKICNMQQFCSFNFMLTQNGNNFCKFYG